MNIINTLLSKEGASRLEALHNPKVMRIVDNYIRLCKPSKVTVLTGSDYDMKYIRNLALERGEEARLTADGHTVHFDGYFDQGRDKQNTRILLPKGRNVGAGIATVDYDEGLKEVLTLLDGCMAGREMLICFFCLGPTNSKFSIAALQITDSAYVVHSESMLYRQGYDEFRRIHGSPRFFHFVHSSGALDSRGNSANLKDRRIYMDLEEERVFTINNQYAGNSVGLKKLALRLAISKANVREMGDWLCEHMFIMGVHPAGKGRTTYFAGAFPSACGKTSTAMVSGQTIVGDDIAYLRAWEDGSVHAANVEQGLFGIIQDINPKDDSLIYNALTTPRELIFSNVLVSGGKPYWLNMGQEVPASGANFAGDWSKGMKGPDGKDVPHAHPNARYTIRIKELENADKNADSSEGVPLSGIIYGGRDPSTSPPILESLSWQHGVFIGAALESETTTATIGQAGVRTHDPMANMDFLVVPLGLYIQNHLSFGERLDKVPKVFATNYFLQDAGRYLNEKTDKKAWLMWMEGRVHGDYGAIETPVGLIPKYEDIKGLFSSIFNKGYSQEEYNKQFSIRASGFLEKLQRIEAIFRKENAIPEVFYEHLQQQRERLEAAVKKFGTDVILPEMFVEE